MKLNCWIFFNWSKQLTDYIYTDIYCKLSKCIGQTLCSYEHYLVFYTYMGSKCNSFDAFSKKHIFSGGHLGFFCHRKMLNI